MSQRQGAGTGSGSIPLRPNNRAGCDRWDDPNRGRIGRGMRSSRASERGRMSQFGSPESPICNGNRPGRFTPDIGRSIHKKLGSQKLFRSAYGGRLSQNARSMSSGKPIAPREVGRISNAYPSRDKRNLSGKSRALHVRPASALARNEALVLPAWDHSLPVLSEHLEVALRVGTGCGTHWGPRAPREGSRNSGIAKRSAPAS